MNVIAWVSEDCVGVAALFKSMCVGEWMWVSMCGCGCNCVCEGLIVWVKVELCVWFCEWIVCRSGDFLCTC